MKFHLSIVNICMAALLSTLISGCSTAELKQMTDDLARINGNAPATAVKSSNSFATMPAADPDKKQVTQLIVPTDPRVRAAMDAAMPNIKKILGIHQCMREEEGLLQLNIYAVQGVNMLGNGSNWQFPNNKSYLKYHDRSKCMSITTLDQWSMPALNALHFRAVYFADDSGETVNFQYLLKKVDDGSWKLESLGKV